MQRYALLAATESKSSKEPKACAAAMMARLVKQGDLKDDQFKVGKTKVHSSNASSNAFNLSFRFFSVPELLHTLKICVMRVCPS